MKINDLNRMPRCGAGKRFSRWEERATRFFRRPTDVRQLGVDNAVAQRGTHQNLCSWKHFAHDLLPEIPTMREVGLKEFQSVTWLQLLARQRRLRWSLIASMKRWALLVEQHK